MRCLIFGAIGLIPLFGAGLAVQALRLRRAVSQEVGEKWTPPVPGWWVAGLLAVSLADRKWGAPGSIAVCVLLLMAQSWHIRQSYHPDTGAVWNPGWPQLIWGTVLASAGLSLSLWLLAVLAARVGGALASA
jgi:hypothetical protein